MRTEMSQNYELAVQKPKSFAVVASDGMMGMMAGSLAVSNGEMYWTYMPMMRAYTEEAAPDSLEQLATSPSFQMAAGGNPIGIQALLAPDPYTAVTKHLRSAEYIGLEKIEDVDHHRIRLLYGPKAEVMAGMGMMEGAGDISLPVDLWITANDKPLVRRMSPDMNAMMKAAAEHMEAHQPAGDDPNAPPRPDMRAMFTNMKMEQMYEFTDWQPDAEIPAERFVFTPPAGVKKVNSFMEAAQAMQNPNAQGSEVQGLEGQPAPEFDLALLDGEGRANLAQHRGKDVVILDFWATWCGPCVRGLPAVNQVASDYRDRGVVFYAVNQRETPEKIREFLENRENLAGLTVALDTDKAVGTAYLVRGIPTTVIIDKEGVVRQVHVGYMPGVENQLRKELDELLAAAPEQE